MSHISLDGFAGRKEENGREGKLIVPNNGNGGRREISLMHGTDGWRFILL